MKARFVGDATDFAKAQLIGILRAEHEIGRLAVLPLFSDHHSETGDCSPVLAAYASVLGVKSPRDVLLGERQFPDDPAGRADFIYAALSEADGVDTLFIDPDTGIRHRLRTPKSTKYVRNHEYVTYEDLVKLLPKDLDRMLIVYDESYARGSLKVVAKAMRIKLQALSDCAVSGFGYYGNAVNLVVLGMAAAATRLLRARQTLIERLAARANRVISLEE